MSDNWTILIPTRPDYVPDPRAQETARALLAELLPQAKVAASVSPETEKSNGPPHHHSQLAVVLACGPLCLASGGSHHGRGLW